MQQIPIGGNTYIKIPPSGFFGVEKYCLHGVTVLNFLLGLTLLPLLVYGIYTGFLTSDFWPDLSSYYAAAHMARYSPSDLYRYQAYIDFYRTIKPAIVNGFFIPLAPPPIAVLFIPLTYMSFPAAYLLWSMVNGPFCFLVMRALMQFGDALGLSRVHTFFFCSCVVGIGITSTIFLRAQLSLVLCYLFILLLFYLPKGRPILCAILLSLLLLIKPPYFIPLFLYMAGCRQWRMVIFTLIFSCIVPLITLPLVGIQSWLDYIAVMSKFSHNYQQIILKGMINLYAFSSYFVSPAWMNALRITANGAYIVFCLLSFLLPFLWHKSAELVSAAFLIVGAMLFATYSQTHDAVLLLPACMVATALMLNCRKARWMLIIYVLASYMAAATPVSCSIILLLLATIIAYLYMHRDRWMAADGAA